MSHSGEDVDGARRGWGGQEDKSFTFCLILLQTNIAPKSIYLRAETKNATYFSQGKKSEITTVRRQVYVAVAVHTHTEYLLV